MTNYQSAVIRINRANTVNELKKLETSFARVYSTGHLTENELMRLYTKTFEKMVTLD